MDERNEFIAFFRETQPKFSRFYSNILTEAGLSLPQYALLNELAQSGIINMTEVGGKLHISKPAVTNLVDRLEKHNFLKRLAHPSDRRVYLLEIQPKGKSLVREIQYRALKLLLTSLDQFSANEQKIITRFYALLSRSMSEFLARYEKGEKRK